ncbi:protein Skeletor, isoforms B/C [Leptopilina boulardi]|uniref:protein Skeletor, isoforms B/C n=1 Tax=Leptopilina boulardi TaxID=63433 RepID=UPI0021F5BBDB|nr:protein Skeletor, isoforms B/C [Leptopilina boulardi]
MKFLVKMLWSFDLVIAFLTFLLISKVLAQENEDESYNGRYLGKLNTYHHQVGGEVYVVDEYTLLFKSFIYDGNGADTFFWAGSTNRPGPTGFIVPDEWGHTNVLGPYTNREFTLTLPDNKKIRDIKWFAVYDINSQNTFGDVHIPEEFDPPLPQKILQLSKRKHNVSSDAIEILDAKTIKIPQLTYDGKGKDTYFWVGVGPQPTSKGNKVPDEYGYLESLREYKSEDIIIQLPGNFTVFNVDWLSIFDIETSSNFGSVIIPDGLNIPPSLVKNIPSKNIFENMDNCVQLHKNFQVKWQIFGPQITIGLIGQIGDHDYMAFGLSGSDERSQMEGADVAVVYLDDIRGYAIDYNITAKAPCGKVLGQYKGVCKDDIVGGLDSNQLTTAVREDGLTKISYRRTLISSDSGDKTYPSNGSVYIVWALGRLDENNEPNFHDIYPKRSLKLELGRPEPYNSCMDFSEDDQNLREPWEKSDIVDRSIRSFKATIGPSGGKKGYQAITGQTTMGLAWYINGQLVPELYLRRGLTYSFNVHGGNNPHSAELYHPLIITDEPHGGYDRLSDSAQSKVRVLAGVEFTRRGRPRPTAVGPLCLSKHNERDRRLDDDFPSFKKFNRTLIHHCEKGESGVLEITPNSSWPDFVYYNSFTHANMGWKIHVIDSYTKSKGFINSSNWFFIFFSIFSCYYLQRHFN